MTLDDQPGPGVLSEVTSAHATKLILGRTHRLATPAEVLARRERSEDRA
jgi:hypothetical protein